ncbi:MAG: hypothetical protein QF903_16055 [Planctomycetota bacterium]|jgi:hypothetical protein|nr:hypothetical protein [Planctomycetota bacterium]MDP6762545.1 hypothetical protein [Planctomycetota bacterium]MDP6990984.1 hypothetical protein [Planctomycetota bacterium]
MALELPSFLRRRLRLHEARRALLAGKADLALERLAHPCLEGFPDADRLRAKATQALARAGASAPAEESRISEALGELLAQMRAARDGAEQGVAPVGVAEGSAAASSVEDAGAAGATEAEAVDVARPLEATEGEPPTRFLLAVDDAGEFLVAWGEQVVLGHARMGEADLPFLADLDARHARIRGGESFHGGSVWRIEPVAGQSITVAGAPIGAGGTELRDGDEVGLAPNLGLLFSLPELSSGVCRLEVLRGAECLGAGRVLLVKPGAPARLRIGARADRHIAVGGLEHDVEFELADGELVVHGEAGLRLVGAPRDEPAPVDLRLACPPTGRVDVVVGRGVGARPPFSFSISPPEDGGRRTP